MGTTTTPQPLEVPDDVIIDRGIYNAFAALVAAHAEAQDVEKMLRDLVKAAEADIRAALDRGRPVAPGIVCRVERITKPVAFDWRRAAIINLGDDAAKDWYSVARDIWDKNGRETREAERLLFDLAENVGESIRAPARKAGGQR